MFEKCSRLQIRRSLEEQFRDLRNREKAVKSTERRFPATTARRKVSSTRSSPNERNMTRRTRPRRLRIHSTFQSGFCAICHAPYSSLEEHVQSKKHLKLIGDDADFIAVRTFDDSFLSLDEIDAAFEYSRKTGKSKMPRTRTSSVLCERVKDSPMSPTESDSGHHLRSRKNINYMTPPLEEDSLTEKPEVVREYRELRSSTRLLAKLTDQIIDSDEVWNSGRPKRACNRAKVTADERLITDNKSYYKVEVLPSKLRSGVAPFQELIKRPETPEEQEEDEKGLMVKFRKMRNSELVQLNNEAENFLFPKKDDQEDDADNLGHSKIKLEIKDDESVHSDSVYDVCSENRKRKKRRTQAEVFINDNQKYYKFETLGSRLRYQGSYLPGPHGAKGTHRHNGDCGALPKQRWEKGSSDPPNVNLNDYKFSFEEAPNTEDWFQTFQRKDRGEEKYIFLSNDNFWNPLLLPYQLPHIQPLNPQDCLTQYTQLKKILMETTSASTSSVTCSTPDPTASNSSTETGNHFVHDEDSKISTTDSTSSTLEELKPLKRKPGRKPKPLIRTENGGKNPRKSPRQHASTLAILSSLIQQRKRRSPNTKGLPTIREESVLGSPAGKVTKSARGPNTSQNSHKKVKIDYQALARSIDEDFSKVCGDCAFADEFVVEEGLVDFRHFTTDIDDLLNVQQYEEGVECLSDVSRSCRVVKTLFKARPGRKAGKRKKNRTGWPLSRSKRVRRGLPKGEVDDDSTVETLSVSAEEAEESLTDRKACATSECDGNGENNNKNEQQTSNGVDGCDELDVVTPDDRLEGDRDCAEEYQPIVRVQKLDKNHIDIGRGDDSRKRRTSVSPKRSHRSQRRMPASPKSPRMLRRPRGRWYRER